MTPAARSVQIFGYYLVLTAVTLFVTPNTLIGLVGIAPTSDPWIRVIGVIVGVLGAYYIVAARENLVPFFRATVWGRALVLAGFIALVLLGWAPAPLIGFGVVDALGAFWTYRSL